MCSSKRSSCFAKTNKHVRSINNITELNNIIKDTCINQLASALDDITFNKCQAFIDRVRGPDIKASWLCSEIPNTIISILPDLSATDNIKAKWVKNLSNKPLTKAQIFPLGVQTLLLCHYNFLKDSTLWQWRKLALV